MSLPKKNLLDMQRDYALDDMDYESLAEIKKLIPLEFNTDKRGNISSKYNGTTVLVDNEHKDRIHSGEMWIVKLKSGISYYYAIPMYPVDSQFIAAVLTEDHCKTFIDYIFDPKKGIKPKFQSTAKDMMEASTQGLLEELAKTGTELKAMTESKERMESQLMDSIAKIKTNQKAWEEEKKNLESQIKELKSSAKSEESKEQKRQMELLRKENIELKKANLELEENLKGQISANKTLKESYEESLQKADESVKTAKSQRDAVAKAREKSIAEYEEQIRNLNAQIESISTGKAEKEQIRNLNEFIDQLQADLGNVQCENKQLLLDYSREKAHAEALEAKISKTEWKSKASSKDDETLAALQAERKIMQESIKEKETENDGLRKANDELRKEIAEMISKMETSGIRDEPNAISTKSKNWVKPSFRVKRVSKEGIESDMFTAPRYSVLTNKIGKELMIKADDHGLVACKDYILEIVGLDQYQPFTKTKTLDVLQDADSGEILVVL